MTSRVTASFTFAQIPDAVLFSGISDRAIRLFAVLHKYSTMPLGAVPARKLLAQRMAGCSLDSIDRALDELVGAGFVEVTPRWSMPDGGIQEGGERPAGSDRTSNMYTLHAEGVAAPLPPPSPQGSPHGGRTTAALSEIDLKEIDPLLSHGHEQIRAHLHHITQRRIFAGKNAPDTDWCVDLIERGATIADCDAAVEAAITKNPTRPPGLPYVRKVLLSRVEEREAGHDPDGQGAGRGSAARGGSQPRAMRRGGLGTRDPRGDRSGGVPGFDASGITTLDSAEAVERAFPSRPPSSAP